MERPRHEVDQVIPLFMLLAALDGAGCSASLVHTVEDELALASVVIVPESLRCEGSTVIVRLADQREYRVTLGTDPRAEVRLAVQLADVLHAQKVEARFASRGVPVVPPVVVPRPSLLRATLLAGATFSGGGFGVQPSIRASGALVFGSVNVGLSVEATVHASKVRSTAGTADSGLGAVQVFGELPFELNVWTLSPRVGAGVLLAWASGRSSSLAYANRTQVAPTGLISAGLSAWRTLTPWLQLGLALDVGVAPFPVVVSIPGASASIGLPLITLAAGTRFQ